MSCGCQTDQCACHGGHAAPAPAAQPDWTLAEFLANAAGLAGLGAITPDAAAAQVIGSDAHVNASSRSGILASARAGQMVNASGSPAYIPGTADCASATGGGSNNLKLVQTASGLALTGLQVGLTTAGVVTGAALAPFTAGISALIGLFPMIFGHHKAAVKKEQNVLCAAVPAANNYLQIIAQAVQSGQASPQQGIDALHSLVSDFQSEVSSIRNDCNAACVMTMQLQAIAAVMVSQYQDLIAAQATNQVVTPARPNVVSSSSGVPLVPGTSPVATPSSYSSFYTGAQPAAAPASSLPSWLPIAAAVAAGFFLMREL